MLIRKLVTLLVVIPMFAFADESDTFAKLLKKQAELFDSELEVKIQNNRSQAKSTSPTNATPLPGARQAIVESEPVVEAIWGVAGKEVAEVNYKGNRVAVSRQEPFISQIDGWKLESIKEFEIVLVRLNGNKVVQRKSVMLTLQGSGSEHSTPGQYQRAPSQPILTPSILAN